MQAQNLQTGLRLYKYKNMQDLISILKKISSHVLIIRWIFVPKENEYHQQSLALFWPWTDRFGLFQALFGCILQFSSGSPIG